MTTPRWRNVFFDLDGTLVDTIKLIVDSHLHSLVEILGPDHGYGEAEIKSWIGTPIMKTFERIVPGRAQAMNDSYVAWNEANTAAYIKVYPGMRELVTDLIEAGVNVGVVTSKRRGPAFLGLELTGLDELIPLVIAADDVTEHKPRPEPLYKAMAAVGGTAADSVYIGDALVDIDGAHNAGLPGVAVTWGAFTAEQLAAAAPEYTVADADELRALLLPGAGAGR